MHGVYFFILPLFAVLLFLLTGAALYMGVFKAHREKASSVGKIASGVFSGVVSCLVWSVLYSHHYLGW